MAKEAKPAATRFWRDLFQVGLVQAKPGTHCPAGDVRRPGAHGVGLGAWRLSEYVRQQSAVYALWIAGDRWLWSGCGSAFGW